MRDGLKPRIIQFDNEAMRPLIVEMLSMRFLGLHVEHRCRLILVISCSVPFGQRAIGDHEEKRTVVRMRSSSGLIWIVDL